MIDFKTRPDPTIFHSRMRRRALLIKITRGGVCALILLLLIYVVTGIIILSSVSPPSPHQSIHYRQTAVVPYQKDEPVSGLLGPRRPRMVWCQQLRFMSSPYRPVIALASFPGSGNTWLRYLLQQATGINTGSVYKDYGLLKNGFPGECIANSSVSVVKTHERGEAAFKGYKKAILLVRDPSHAIQAEFNRQGGGHIGFAPSTRYKLRKGKYWARFVDEQLLKWKKTNLDWLFNFTRPILVLFYEDLVNDVETNLRDVINFIEIKVNEEYLQCAVDRREGIYRRKKRLLGIDPFTPEMKENIERIKQEVYKYLHEYIQNMKEEIS